jgi:division protein 1
LTGSDDSTVRLWDLRRVEEEDDLEIVAYSDAAGSDGGDCELVERPNGIRNGSVGGSELGRETALVRVLEGHSKAVTSMYFEDECLVSSDIGSTPPATPD